MARADLLINLVKASVSGDQQTLKRTVEAMAAEERAKQHTVLAERLEHAMISNENGRENCFARIPKHRKERATSSRRPLRDAGSKTSNCPKLRHSVPANS
jgi:hypothetical protein